MRDGAPDDVLSTCRRPDHPDGRPGRIRLGQLQRTCREELVDLADVGVEGGQLDDVRESRALSGKSLSQAREEVVGAARHAAGDDERAAPDGRSVHHTTASA